MIKQTAVFALGFFGAQAMKTDAPAIKKGAMAGYYAIEDHRYRYTIEDSLRCLSTVTKRWRDVVLREVSGEKILVHYQNFHDEWIDTKSGRLDDDTTGLIVAKRVQWATDRYPEWSDARFNKNGNIRMALKGSNRFDAETFIDGYNNV